MGVWYLAMALGDSVGGQTYRLTTVVPMPVYYLVLALAAVAAGLLMLLFVRRLRVLMAEHHLPPVPAQS